MSQGERTCWIGADPGGRGNFSVAVLYADGSAKVSCVDFADEALDVVGQWAKNSGIVGVGVDAPLWWSSGRSGERYADQWLRDTYRLIGGQVQALNSLRGAALVQGAMFVQRIRERFPDVLVTETHPKALMAALDIGNAQVFCDCFSVEWDALGRPDHERDAVVSAVAAREGFEGRWAKDLSISRYPSEQDPSQFWLGPVHYFWPLR